MRKYSKFVGADVMQKYNIESIYCVINNRAHRTLSDDGSISLEPKTYSDIHTPASEGKTKFSLDFSTVQMVYSYPERSFVTVDDDKVCIVIPTVKVVANDAYITVKEELEPSIIFMARDLIIRQQRCRPYMGYKMVNELINKHYPELISGKVSKDDVDSAIRLIRGFQLGLDYDNNRDIARIIMEFLSSMSFFRNDESMKFCNFLSKLSIATVKQRIRIAGEMGTKVDNGFDLIRLFDVPESFKTVCMENPSSICDGYSFSADGFCKVMEKLGNYSLYIQNVLAYYCLVDSLGLSDLQELTKNVSPDAMNKIDPEVLKKFILRDFKKGKGFTDFNRILVRLRASYTPITTATMSMKYLSHLEQESAWMGDFRKSGVIDVFEEILEKDALKAMRYLRSKED